MKLSPAQTDEAALCALGEQASSLLVQRDYTALAHRFGYALAFDREPSAALQEDYLRAMGSPHPNPAKGAPPIAVSYFKPNTPGLFALVECTIPVTDSAAVLLELIVSGTPEERHITVEDISGALS
jgi:hypothetical protein